MAQSVDYNALKARTLGSGADEEAVTVNTRALIDKVLARYSGEWTVLRELLQNAADAGATKVSIKLETLPSATVPLPQTANGSDLLKHLVTNHTLKRLLVINNGQTFNENDWSRLKRIAEGNPDESKIGAFGVGFYSVFADCEEPFVSSGKEAMAFYWRGNSLFTRRLHLSGSDACKDTSFVLDYRNTTSPVPSLMQVSQFLASSLTFVGIQDLELWLDDHKILQLSKKVAPSLAVDIPRDIETKTPEGLMRIKSVMREVAQIDGSWMNIVGWKSAQSGASRLESFRNNDATPALRNFFSRLAGSSASREDQSSRMATLRNEIVQEDLTARSSTVIFLNVSTATIETSTSQLFKDELERATKKPPPKMTKLAIMSSPHIPEPDADSSTLETLTSADVFASVLPTKSGRIFIGFPTHQTTGLRAHISAPSVIPTVERESIDLNARWVRTWNIEMLRAAGIVCRIAWSSEMAILDVNIQRTVVSSGKSKVRTDDISSSLPGAISIARTYSIQESTPSAQIGQVIEDAFWACNKKASIDILSTCGVLPNHEIRIASKSLSFMEGIPTLPEQFVSEAKTFVDRLIAYGLVIEVTVSDIKSALERCALSPQQVHEFLAWLSQQSTSGKLDGNTVQNLLSVAVANEEAANVTSTRMIALGSITAFLNPNKIPVGLPVPFWTMPFRYTKQLSKSELERYGWEELQIVPWVKWLLQEAASGGPLSVEQSFTQSPKFAAQVLPVLSKQWDTLSQSSKDILIDLLAARTIIPTKCGMRRPGDAYFPSVKVFDDLPIVTGLSSVKDKLLVSLGVRKTLELGVVFSRLLSDVAQSPYTGMSEKWQWKHVGLIQYLASVREDIPPADIQRLRDTPICPKETPHDTRAFSEERYKVSSLYEPRPVLRELGLPTLSWSGPYRSGSSEGKLLAVLGLRTTPSVNELIQIMARSAKTGDGVLRDKAMGYFIGNHYANGYGAYDYSQVTLQFLPLQTSANVSAPSRCFTDEGAALFGFDVLKHELQPHATKFGVNAHPPMDECIAILTRKPPTSKKDARTIFAYLAGRLSEINSTNIPRLSQSKFVPFFTSTATQSEKNSSPCYIAPKTCFLGASDTYGEIFSFVDFGQEANAFLVRCGSKQEPTKLEVAQILVNEPARISSTFQDPDKYLHLLRNLADSLAVLKKDKELFKAMKRAPFLLVSKDVASAAPSTVRPDEGDDTDDEDANGIKEWQLTSAANAIIVDDYPSFSLFRTDIMAAPQETSLEEFYYNLGSPLLSSLIEESANYGSRAPDQKPAARLRKQICERSRLLLHDQPPDAIKHDAKWLEKNLQVVVVSSIKLRRSLKGRNLHHVERRSAAVTQSGREYMLWISGNHIDYYQVSQSLVHLLLTRPKLHSALTLEMLLKTELKELGARGFNVSRILRQKAAEKRLADQQEQLEEERKRIQDQGKAWNDSQKRQVGERARESRIPGDFPPDSPQAKTTRQNIRQPEDDEPIRRMPQGLFENWKNRLGINYTANPLPVPPSGNNRLLDASRPAVSDSDEPPPPYSQEQEGQHKDVQPNPVTAPHQLQQNLLSAIQKSRAYNSNTLYSRGETNQIAETRSYCDESMAQNLTCIANGKHGIHIFVSKSTTTDTSAFLAHNSAGLSAFATLLQDIASVFALDFSSLNIFYDHGKSIAFNRQGSIFCNYLFFQQLHEERVVRGDGKREDALLYWWVTLCHELAHNLVSDHSSEHSYYIEHFVIEYMRKITAKISSVDGGQVASA